MEPRTGSASETVRSLEPRVTRQLANEPPTPDSVLGMADILESAIAELEAHTNADADPIELRLVSTFLATLVGHIDELMARADVPLGTALDRVRTASLKLHKLRGRIDGWYRDRRITALRRGLRPARWESLDRARGIISIGGDAVEDCRALDRSG